MRAVHTLFLLALAASPVLAQTTDQNAAQRTVDQREQLQNQEQAGDRQNQRVERIQVEDEGSRVNELRVGGQTQSITVQPKTGSMPEYEIQPGEGARTRPRNGAETNTAPRVWNVMKF